MDYTVSGGLGFIGKNLIIKLYKDRSKSKISVLDKLSEDDLTSNNVAIPYSKTFIHLAAATNVRESILNPEDHINQNIKMTLNCLKHARLHESTFIFASSQGAPLSMSPYSASKLACESFCKAYKESYGLNTKILRFSNVYGPHSIYKTSVISKFIKACLDKQSLSIIGNGLQTRDFVHIDDVINTIIDPLFNEITYVGSGKTVTILSIAKMIQRLSTSLTSFTPELIFYPAIPGEITDVDTYTDIRPTINLEEGLETTFKWFMENYKC